MKKMVDKGGLMDFKFLGTAPTQLLDQLLAVQLSLTGWIKLKRELMKELMGIHLKSPIMEMLTLQICSSFVKTLFIQRCILI